VTAPRWVLATSPRSHTRARRVIPTIALRRAELGLGAAVLLVVVVLFVLPLCRARPAVVVSAHPLGKVSAESAPQGWGSVRIA
jgi:hypothetical protein